jgi:hypothetical protein
MSEWITDMLPTKADVHADGRVWIMYEGDAVMCRFETVEPGEPWQHIIRPAPYVKPKRCTMNTKSKYAIYKVVFETDKKKPCRMYINSEKQNLVASFYDDPETVAMFQLFAAAPEMLEVLEELDECASYWSQYDVPIGIHDRIKRAIAKAKGVRP